MKILVVDNEDRIAKYVARNLEAAFPSGEVDTFIVNDPFEQQQELISYVQNSKWDLVLVDLMFDKAPDKQGMGLARALRRELPRDAKVAIYSSSIEPKDVDSKTPLVRECIGTGVDAVLSREHFSYGPQTLRKILGYGAVVEQQPNTENDRQPDGRRDDSQQTGSIQSSSGNSLVHTAIMAIVTLVAAVITAWATVHATLKSNDKSVKEIRATIREADISLNSLKKVQPIGIIVGSSLRPSLFSEQVGDPQNFDPQTSKWAVADGSRDISVSRYAKITGNTHAPDLRGSFIRGASQRTESQTKRGQVDLLDQTVKEVSGELSEKDPIHRRTNVTEVYFYIKIN